MNNNDMLFSKIDEFLEDKYFDSVADFLKKYPDKMGFIIDYNDLTAFDSNLGSLLIHKPKKVLNLFRKVIENIGNCKLSKEKVSSFYNVWMDSENVNSQICAMFDNVPNVINFINLNESYINKLVVSEGIIVEMDKLNGLITKITLRDTYSSKELELDSCFSGLRTCKIKVGDVIEFTGVPKSFGSNDTLDFIDVNFIKIVSKGKEEIKTEKTHRKNLIGDDVTIEEYSYLAIEDEQEEINSRNSPEYKEWVNSILSRDDSNCIICGEKRAPHTHHVFGYKKHPNYRLDVDNGVVLCRWCHHKYHDVFGKDTANPVTLIKFLKGDY